MDTLIDCSLKKYYSSLLLICALVVFQLSACSQATKEKKMKAVTEKLITHLGNCDTTNILSLYEVSASHIDQESYRTFTKEVIMNGCGLFNKVTANVGLPSLEKLSFTKDPQNGANVAILPITTQQDTVMNLKSCTLYVVFYPDQFFNGKILQFTVSRENLKPKETLKIKELPPIN
jgi:hypothetical protein